MAKPLRNSGGFVEMILKLWDCSFCLVRCESCVHISRRLIDSADCLQRGLRVRVVGDRPDCGSRGSGCWRLDLNPGLNFKETIQSKIQKPLILVIGESALRERASLSLVCNVEQLWEWELDFISPGYSSQEILRNLEDYIITEITFEVVNARGEIQYQ